MFQLSEKARERKVPVTRIGRLMNFGGGCVFTNVSALFKSIFLDHVNGCIVLKAMKVPFRTLGQETILIFKT